MNNEAKLKTIVDYVSKRVGVDVSLKTRDKEVILGRALYYKIALRDVQTSLKNIGGIVGKNHATVVHSRNKVFPQIEDEDFYMNVYKEYFGELEGPTGVTPPTHTLHILTENERQYRDLSDSNRLIYDERAALVLRSFAWKLKDDNRKEVFEIINVSQ